MPRIVVTGASGFIGLPLAVELAARGAEVHGVSRHANGHPSVVWHEVDLLDPAAAERAIRAISPEVLVHAAWEAGPGYQVSPDNTRWLHASETMLALAIDSGVRRAVGIGSCAEYDWSSASPLSEDTPLHPGSLYGECKAELSAKWLATTAARGVEGVWARPFFQFGPRENPARLVPSVARAVLAGRPAPIGGGDQVFDFCYTLDTARFIVDLVLSDVCGAVNIGTGIGTSVVDFARMVATEAGGADLLRPAAPSGVGVPARVFADVSRLRDEVGSPPPTPFAQAVRDVVQWWREQPAEA